MLAIELNWYLLQVRNNIDDFALHNFMRAIWPQRDDVNLPAHCLPTDLNFGITGEGFTETVKLRLDRR
ncbi:hypothetical protein D3C76_1301390 [compost metagenome]